MTFDIKKFLKDTKAGPYGMIQESKLLKEYSWDDEGTDDPDREEMADVVSDKGPKKGIAEENPFYDYKSDSEDSDEDSLGSEESRIMAIGGDQIERGIQSLIDDGFHKSDIMGLVKSILYNSGIEHQRTY